MTDAKQIDAEYEELFPVLTEIDRREGNARRSGMGWTRNDTVEIARFAMTAARSASAQEIARICEAFERDAIEQNEQVVASWMRRLQESIRALRGRQPL